MMRVKLWDVDSWQEVLTLEGAGSLFRRTAFSPDGNAIGTMSSDGILHVWQAPSVGGNQRGGGEREGGDQAALNAGHGQEH